MCDVEKLVFCVQIRQGIYNPNSKEYTDKKTVDSSWEEVAKEMNMTVSECKAKWCILRNSYGRYLREENKIAAGIVSKKKRKVWHLAEAMSFLKEYMGRPPPKKVLDLTNESSNDDSAIDNPRPNDEHLYNENESHDYFHEHNPVNKKQRVTGIEKLTDPLIEYFKTKSKKTESEDENLTFFRSILPDMKELSARRQRQLKQNFLINLNQLLDEQEKELGHPGVTWDLLKEEKEFI